MRVNSKVASVPFHFCWTGPWTVSNNMVRVSEVTGRIWCGYDLKALFSVTEKEPLFAKTEIMPVSDHQSGEAASDLVFSVSGDIKQRERKKKFSHSITLPLNRTLPFRPYDAPEQIKQLFCREARVTVGFNPRITPQEIDEMVQRVFKDKHFADRTWITSTDWIEHRNNHLKAVLGPYCICIEPIEQPR